MTVTPPPAPHPHGPPAQHPDPARPLGRPPRTGREVSGQTLALSGPPPPNPSPIFLEQTAATLGLGFRSRTLLASAGDHIGKSMSGLSLSLSCFSLSLSLSRGVVLAFYLQGDEF